jgi:hypothetical protein
VIESKSFNTGKGKKDAREKGPIGITNIRDTLYYNEETRRLDTLRIATFDKGRKDRITNGSNIDFYIEKTETSGISGKTYKTGSKRAGSVKVNDLQYDAFTGQLKFKAKYADIDRNKIENGFAKKSYNKNSIMVAGLMPGLRYSYNSNMGFFIEIAWVIIEDDMIGIGGGLNWKISSKTLMNAGLKFAKGNSSDYYQVYNNNTYQWEYEYEAVKYSLTRLELSLQTHFNRFTLLYGAELYQQKYKHTVQTDRDNTWYLPVPILGFGFNF